MQGAIFLNKLIITAKRCYLRHSTFWQKWIAHVSDDSFWFL